MDNHEPIEVKDLHLAAYLYATTDLFRGIRREGKVCWFVFTNADKIMQMTNRYWTNDAECKAKSLVDAIRTLKDMIYSN